MTADVLRVHDLLVYYDTPAGAVTAVNHISFSLKAGERLGLAGESGSGKSTLALSILRLLKPPGRVAAGEVWLDDVNLMTLCRRRHAPGTAGPDCPDSAGLDELAESGHADQGADSLTRCRITAYGCPNGT